MPFGSRNKGASAEREVAKKLEAWWCLREPGVRFVKTPLSGGWSSAKVRGDFRASGDLMTTSASFPFCVEVKRREQFTWATVLAGSKSPVWHWWEQAKKAAAEANLVPMLWARRNREKWRIILPGWFASEAHCELVTIQATAELVEVFDAEVFLAVQPGTIQRLTRKVGCEMDAKDTFNVTITGTPSMVCPYCKSPDASALDESSLPITVRDELANYRAGLNPNERLVSRACSKCGSQWVVQIQTVMPMPSQPKMNRHQRRAMAAIQRRSKKAARSASAEWERVRYVGRQ